MTVIGRDFRARQSFERRYPWRGRLVECAEEAVSSLPDRVAQSKAPLSLSRLRVGLRQMTLSHTYNYIISHTYNHPLVPKEEQYVT